MTLTREQIKAIEILKIRVNDMNVEMQRLTMAIACCKDLSITADVGFEPDASVTWNIPDSMRVKFVVNELTMVTPITDDMISSPKYSAPTTNGEPVKYMAPNESYTCCICNEVHCVCHMAPANNA